MQVLWVDPSFTGTGLCLEKEGRELVLGKVSRAETKRGLKPYFEATMSLKAQLSKFIADNVTESYVVMLEAPVISGHSSPGLFGLQMIYLELFQDDPACQSVQSISPAWIRGTLLKNHNVAKKGKGPRKEFAITVANSLISKGVKIHNYSSLKAAGDDVGTALLFMICTKLQKRQWPYTIGAKNG